MFFYSMSDLPLVTMGAFREATAKVPDDAVLKVYVWQGATFPADGIMFERQPDETITALVLQIHLTNEQTPRSTP